MRVPCCKVKLTEKRISQGTSSNSYLETPLPQLPFQLTVYPLCVAWCGFFQKNERWFEDTLPNLIEFHFKQAFRVTPSTFRYLVKSLACVLNRLSTQMRMAISVEKRVAIGLYRLCSSAEDRTIAHLFAVGRSTVNVLWRQFCTAVIEQLEGQWLCMCTATCPTTSDNFLP